MESLRTAQAVAGVLVSLLGVAVAVGSVRWARRHRHVLTTGLEAQAVCLNTYVDDDSSPSPHAILSFRTHDGAEIRAADKSGQARTTGDVVTVRYLPTDPMRAYPVDAGTRDTAISLVAILAIAALFTAGGIALSVASLHTG
ncbi:hypothetical protein GCM10010193_39820 [Kitasatospora atroaurantiaca]|uniref:Uncharacterized protein DUF3592 n=1 Tax=Kitasatospora atroaurantiaca TaxID=285545 RepID=A0A561EKV5_9ACTN|nr:DUF3592 domain-containing protein [Kitasatospora atroaurantiaca]TWE16244.1 uncharacterized protein DUF3592 [Kitasatospora atroaurantiaca]